MENNTFPSLLTFSVKSKKLGGLQEKRVNEYWFEAWAHMGQKGAKSLQSACKIILTSLLFSSLTQRRSVHTVLWGCLQQQLWCGGLMLEAGYTYAWMGENGPRIGLLNKWRPYMVKWSSEEELYALPLLQCWWTASITISSQSIGWLNSVWN